jgi:hypothetical protein
MPYDYEILEHSSNALIVALSETEVGKVFLPAKWVWVDVKTGEPMNFLSEGPTCEKEATALQYANTINDLMPKFIRTDTWQTEEGETCDMIVMERLFPLPIHHFPLPVRAQMMEQFERRLKELHDKQFVHGDLMRPTNYFTRGDQEWMFKNILQTQKGLRLIDAGFGTICQKDNIKMFVHILFRERKEIEYFRDYYLIAP